MRSFIISSIIFITITALVIINSVILVNEANSLLADSELIMADGGSAASQIEKLNAHWQNCRRMFMLSVNNTEIEKAEEALNLMNIYFANNETADFNAQLQLFRDAVRRMADAQKLTFIGVF